VFAGKQLMWSSSDTSRAVLVLPEFCFGSKSKAEDGVWQKNRVLLEVGQKRDTFYLDKNRVHYLGVYECLEDMTLSLEDVGKLSSKLHAQTILSPFLVPPIMMRMLPSMYSSGVLKAKGFSLQRVAFNQKLYEAFIGGGEQKGSVKTVVTTYGRQSSNNRKRKEVNSTNNQGRNKRLRSSSSKHSAGS